MPRRFVNRMKRAAPAATARGCIAGLPGNAGGTKKEAAEVASGGLERDGKKCERFCLQSRSGLLESITAMTFDVIASKVMAVIQVFS